MTTSLTDNRRAALGALWMLGAVASFTLMAVAGRSAAAVYDTFEIMLYRSLSGLVMLLAFAAATGRLGQIGHRRLGLMGLRNVFHFAGQNCWFYAITVLPLAQVFALEFTTPIWVLLLAPFTLGERITGRGALVAGLGFAGILIVTRPWSGSADPALILAALAAVGFAVSAITTRALTRTETVISILFWLHVMQAAMALVAAGIDGDIAPPQWDQAIPLLSVGLLGLTAHACLTTALSLAPAQRVMPVDFLRLPLIIVLGWVLYQEPANLWVILGGGLILFSNWLNLTTPRRS